LSGIPSERLAIIRIEMADEDDGKKGIRLGKDFMCAAVTVRLV
jgi:hypothetical protein